MSTEKPEGETQDVDEGTLSPAEQAMLQEMERETPMPTKDEGTEGESEKADPAQAAKPEGEVEAKAADDEDDPDVTIDEQGRARDKDGKFVESVPKSAYLRTKERVKAERDARAALEVKQAATEARLHLLTEIINSGGEKKPNGADKAKAPDNPWEEADINPAEDIVKAFDQQRRRSQYLLQSQAKQAESHNTYTAEVAAVNGYIADVRRLCNEQIAKGDVVEANGKAVPHYAAAYKHLSDLRHAQLEAVGVTDKSARDKIIGSEEKEIVEGATKAKRSPAEAIYKLALASGFKAPEKKAANGAAANGKSEHEKRVEQIARGQKETKSLSGAGGAAYQGLTGSQIANMSEEDFVAFASKLSEGQLHKLLGEGA